MSAADGRWDVIVAGAGPAGFAAAVAAARAGARTLVIEKNPFCGGTWTAGAMCLVIDADGKGGLMAELLDRLKAAGAWARYGGWADLFTIEPMKMVLEEMLASAEVEVRLHTLLLGARREGRRIASVQTASKSGPEEFAADVYVDATGDGDLAARAGCAFDVGRPGDGKCQPGTMFALVGGWPEAMPPREVVRDVLLGTGFDLSYHGLTVFAQPGQPGLAVLMASHLYGVDATDASSLTEAERLGRRQVHEAVAALRGSGDARFARLFVVSTGPFATVREGRRVRGRYVLTADDCRAGRSFDDAVCRVAFNFDVHHVDPSEGRHLDAEKVPPYEVPYRSLVAADVDNLLLSGRCISGDFLAHSSYRVTGDAVPTGEAAGRAAAIAAAEGVAPADVDASRVAPGRADQTSSGS